MGQAGFTKKITVLILFVIVLVVSYAGYRHAHANAPEAQAQKVAAAKQVAKLNYGNLLQGKLVTAWKRTLSTSPPDGNVDVALYDNGTGATVHYANGTGTSSTASIIKLSILENTLWKDQKKGSGGLSQSQLSAAVPMIENSDNNAASTLYLGDGGSSALNAFFKKIGANSSLAGQHWGLTQTTSLDQLKVVNQVAYPGGALSAASAKQANSLMDQVELDQRWGVSGGVPDGVTVELKDGWLTDSSDNDEWIVNSIGHVHGESVDYTIAVLTNNNKSEEDGINTIQALSADAWKAVSTTKVP